MLITICYSILTWIQSRHRQETLSWVEEFCVGKESSSLLLIRQKLVSQLFLKTGCSESNSACEKTHKLDSISISSDGTNRIVEKHTNNLCYNSQSVTRTCLIWEDGERSIRILACYPIQIVELHDWTAFIGTKIEKRSPLVVDLDEESSEHKCYVLLEAEPGVTRNKNLFKKFGQFGEITAWKCGAELGLILQSDLKQLVELMHIFRQGQIILEGGWRIHRLTTISCEGTIGTLIAKDQIDSKRTSLSPGDLRRLAAGIYEYGESTPSTSATATPSKSVSISQDTSKHDITKISEETLNDGSAAEADDQVDITKLPNWYERSPKKRLVAPTHTEKPIVTRRKSFSNSLSNLSQRSSSLASLLKYSRSLSVEETERRRSPSIISPVQTPDKEHKGFKPKSRQQSCESLSTQDRNSGSLIVSSLKTMSLSTSLASSPMKCKSGLNITPSRLGKPPNILILCDEEKTRRDLASVLKKMFANDRYAIYDIRWDQLSVGGWEDQTALLVISGKIESSENIGLLLQFLGDGGRLLAWCCETAPFGIICHEANGTSVKNSFKKLIKENIIYGNSQTLPLSLTGLTWGTAKENSLPSRFQRVLETNDSEGYSRPLTASVFAKVKESQEAVVINLDGGALGGKAVLSQIHFEETIDEESCLALLSLLLSQHLGMDCTRIKTLEYSIGYLLGDHVKINIFLSETPSTLKQRNLTLEFVSKGTKGPNPSHSLFPIHSLECPAKFSTVDYFNNLETKELGRLVIYSDVMTSTMDILTGNFLRHGVTAIARQQTAGRGRGKNVWLSPDGCAVFSFQLSLNLESSLGRRITLLQHIAALAMITAVSNHKEIKLRVKWPNDVYLNDQKIGGILVESRFEGNDCVVNIGIGVNVCNSYPTVCLNSALSSDGKSAILSCESYIAKALTQMEILLDNVEKCPLKKILNLYEDNWIHNSEDEVNVEISEGKFASCRLNGIDEFGFLRVTEINSGQVFSVQPDGNSFDISNRLIAIKN